MELSDCFDAFRYCITSKQARIWGRIALGLIVVLLSASMLATLCFVYFALYSNASIRLLVIGTPLLLLIDYYLGIDYYRTRCYFYRSFKITFDGISIRMANDETFYPWDDISEIAIAVIATDAGHNNKNLGIVIVLHEYKFDFFRNKLTFGTIEFSKEYKNVIVIDNYESVLDKLYNVFPREIKRRIYW